MWPCCLNQHQILLVLSDCGRNNKLRYSTEHLKNRHTLFISSGLFGCVLFFLGCVQLKKLVYVYLVRHAEEQQDLALLSISTFQRALKVPYNT